MRDCRLDSATAPLLTMPKVVALLHSQPETRTVAAELPQAHRHFRTDAGRAGKDPMEGLADPVCRPPGCWRTL